MSKFISIIIKCLGIEFYNTIFHSLLLVVVHRNEFSTCFSWLRINMQYSYMSVHLKPFRIPFQLQGQPVLKILCKIPSNFIITWKFLQINKPTKTALFKNKNTSKSRVYHQNITYVQHALCTAAVLQPTISDHLIFL